MVSVDDEDFRKMRWALERAHECAAGWTRFVSAMQDQPFAVTRPLEDKLSEALEIAKRYKVAPGQPDPEG